MVFTRLKLTVRWEGLAYEVNPVKLLMRSGAVVLMVPTDPEAVLRTLKEMMVSSG